MDRLPAPPIFPIALNNRLQISPAADGRGIFLSFHPVLPERRGKSPQAGVRQYDTENAITLQLSPDEAVRLAACMEQVRMGQAEAWKLVPQDGKVITLAFHDPAKARSAKQGTAKEYKKLWIGKSDGGRLLLGASTVPAQGKGRFVSIPLTYESEEFSNSPRVLYQIERALTRCLDVLTDFQATQAAAKRRNSGPTAAGQSAGVQEPPPLPPWEEEESPL
jgi:hypothetical protein